MTMTLDERVQALPIADQSAFFGFLEYFEWQPVRINVRGDGHTRMAEPLLNDLWVNFGLQQVRRVAVP